jgi:hypothetical protein
MKKKILISVLIFFVALIIVSNIVGKGCIVYHEEPFKGKVIDAETKEPIEGTVIVAIYKVRYSRIIESDKASEDAVEVLTSKNGEFYIPPHLYISLKPFASGAESEFIIYKPGYTAFPGRAYNYFHKYFPDSPLRVSTPELAEIFKKGVTVELLKLKTKEERIRNIPGAIDDMGSWKLPKLFKAINEEDKRFGL